MTSTDSLVKLFLIGLPGSGKTTLAKALATQLSLPFIDLDAEIEKEEHRPVNEIFKRSGEAYFRKIESAVLAGWCARPDRFVMATGGGAPCFHENMELMNRAGVTVFLDVPASEITARIQRSKLDERPLLVGLERDQLKDKIEFLRTHRAPYYKQAYLTISGTSLTASDILAYLTSQ